MKPAHEDATEEAREALDQTVSARRGDSVPHAAPALPGRYEDLGPIGGGSFGEVRRVRDTLLERVVAMKLLRSEHTGVAHIRHRFLVEAQITAQFQHPGIVALYDRKLGTWDIARLDGGGSMDGPGYGCGIRDFDARPLGDALCGAL